MPRIDLIHVRATLESYPIKPGKIDQAVKLLGTHDPYDHLDHLMVCGDTVTLCYGHPGSLNPQAAILNLRRFLAGD